MLWSQRAVDRARGRVNVHRLVAQGLQLGEGAFVSRESHLDPEWPWLITIEDEAVVSPHVVVIAHDASLMRHTGVCRISPVVIGRGAVVGAAAVILPGTRIGAGSVVGAGAVVRGDIPPDSLVVGNPAKVVSDVEKLVAWQRAELARAVTWPFEGWSRGSGIDEQRKLQQWETLRSGTPGFLARRGADRPPRGG